LLRFYRIEYRSATGIIGAWTHTPCSVCKPVRSVTAPFGRPVKSIKSLAKLSKSIRQKRPAPHDARAVRSSGDKPYCDMTAIEAAERVLLEGTPLRLTELTVEVQARGCRMGDDPRAVAHAIRSAMRYHKVRFSRDKCGRWSVVQMAG
jgi:hypothetical protein